MTHNNSERHNLDAYLEKIVNLIEEHGWAVQAVMTNPPVFYTVGLTLRYRLPELVVSGLDFDTARGILNELAVKLKKKELVLVENKNFDEVFEGFSARFKQLSEAEAQELKVAAIFTPDESPVNAWQLLWPDPSGKFSDDPDVDPLYANMQNLSLIFSEQHGPASH